MDLAHELRTVGAGDVRNDRETLERYATDASAFRIVPAAVVSPRSVAELSALVNFVRGRRERGDHALSLTARAGGTDMTGGPLTESIVVDCATYLNRIIAVTDEQVTAQPGAFYRDVEQLTLARHRIFPAYPASKSIAAIGGMVANNAGGEKSLRYGQTADHVRSLKAILADGHEYSFTRLSKAQVAAKRKQRTFEGALYRTLYTLVTRHHNLIEGARPKVSKNSTGYLLWNVLDPKAGSIDLGQLLVGSQGTLGLITQASLGIVPMPAHTELLAIYVPDLSTLPTLVRDLLDLEPTSVELFDDKTIRLVVRFLPQLLAAVSKEGNPLNFGLGFLPDLAIMAARGLPKLVLLAEFEGEDKAALTARVSVAAQTVARFGFPVVRARSHHAAQKYWTIRRQSFALLRQAGGTKQSVPFIDDLIVPPAQLGEFLTKLSALLAHHPSIPYSIAGHAGNGNLHVIPLLDLANPRERALIPKLSEQVYELALSLGGSISAEHNEGLIRGPYTKRMYGEKVFALFRIVKRAFDPLGIFNPHKKTDADLRYSLRHLKTSNTRR